MPFGRSAYGLVVESHEGRPTKIEGNELHPSTTGRSTVRMQGAILGLYDPDRAQRVLHDGKDATWAEFVTQWGELEKKHLADGGASLALLTPSFASPTRHRMLEPSARGFRGAHRVHGRCPTERFGR
jgi:molybdopterin-containing oxidoreductase family iron-sulfur binding subunit